MKAHRGFSMVELLVALVLSGILMGGMVKIFSTSISTLHRTGELAGAQRRNRWILNEFGDDLRMAGHTEGLDVLPSSLQEQPFRIVPGSRAGSDRDTIDLFMNEAIQELTVSTGTAALAASLTLSGLTGATPNLNRGDLLVIKDGVQAEYAYVGADSRSGQVELMDEATQQTQRSQSGVSGYVKYGAFPLQRPHNAGNRVTVLRPWQLIHYGIEDRALDPSNPDTQVPCLVRKQAVFGSGAQANWSTVTGEIVAENVSALRLDLSVDGGVHWEHGDDWAATVDLANSRLPSANQIDANTFWFKRVPAQVRVEIRSRTPLARTEYSNTAGGTAYKERTQVLVVTPRNFASPL